jgi:hypothetical protein
MDSRHTANKNISKVSSFSALSTGSVSHEREEDGLPNVGPTHHLYLFQRRASGIHYRMNQRVISFRFLAVVRIRIRIQSGQWIRIQEGKNDLKNRKSSEISCFELLDVLFFRAEDFSCSLDVLNEG